MVQLDLSLQAVISVTAPGVGMRAPPRSRSACSPEELASGDRVGVLLLGCPESPGLLPSFRLRFLHRHVQLLMFKLI